MPRFVILHHSTPKGFARAAHWDLMLEDGGQLLTWALAAPPHVGCEIDAEQLSNHRVEYLEFEGPLSGSRGTVERADAGEYEWLERRPNDYMIDLRGKTFRGRAQLSRREGQSWRFSLKVVLA